MYMLAGVPNLGVFGFGGGGWSIPLPSGTPSQQAGGANIVNIPGGQTGQTPYFPPPVYLPSPPTGPEVVPGVTPGVPRTGPMVVPWGTIAMVAAVGLGLWFLGKRNAA